MSHRGSCQSLRTSCARCIAPDVLRLPTSQPALRSHAYNHANVGLHNSDGVLTMSATRCGCVFISVLAVVTGVMAFRPSAGPPVMPMPHPTVSDYQFIATGTTPPTNADCEAVLRT